MQSKGGVAKAKYPLKWVVGSENLIAARIRCSVGQLGQAARIMFGVIVAVLRSLGEALQSRHQLRLDKPPVHFATSASFVGTCTTRGGPPKTLPVKSRKSKPTIPKSFPNGCPAWIRTMTRGSKVPCATITPPGSGAKRLTLRRTIGWSRPERSAAGCGADPVGVRSISSVPRCADPRNWGHAGEPQAGETKLAPAGGLDWFAADSRVVRLPT
jgi:hypothetical protein